MSAPAQVQIGTKTNGRVAWLDTAAAASFERMRRAGMPTGGITDAGRTNAEQWALWYAYLRGELAATAAYPGTSLHETGHALDLAEPARAWVRAWGEPYGWIKDMVRNEPWHMTYVAARDTHAAQTVSNPVVALPTIPTVPDVTAPTLPTPVSEEDDMPRPNTADVVAINRAYFGIDPGPYEAVRWAVKAEDAGWTIKATREQIKARTATEDDVRAAFAAGVTYTPSSAQVTEWVGKPLADLVTALKADPSAKG